MNKSKRRRHTKRFVRAVVEVRAASRSPEQVDSPLTVSETARRST